MPLATPTRRMPRPEFLRDHLTNLIGKNAVVKEREPIDVNDPDAVMYTVTLVDPDEAAAGIMLADLAFASYAGACLVLIPKGAADDAVEAGELSESLLDNFSEVANVMTGLLNGPITSHLKVGGVSAGVDEATKSLVLRAAGRKFFDIDIPEYGAGVLAMYAT